ncbi:MAG: FlgD immunoglobulin-like domain containing protein, partial [bacterium]
SIRKWRDTHIWCRVPAGAQTGPVTVTTSCGTSSGRQFTMAPPVSKKLGPQVGGVGQRVTLWGNQFGRTRGTSKVTFNNTEVTQYESWSNNRVVVRVPEGAISGPVTVNTGVSGPSGKVVVSNAITFQVLGDQGGPPVPEDYALEQNYPNPFNPTTSIQYSVVSDQSLPHVTLKIYNILGQEVRTLVDEPKEAGYYSATWDGKDDRGENVSSGIYFYSLHAGDFGETKKMVLMR